MRISHGKRINYENDVVVVFNDKNEIVYKGIVDYCPWKDQPIEWNSSYGYYKILGTGGYTMVCIA